MLRSHEQRTARCEVQGGGHCCKCCHYPECVLYNEVHSSSRHRVWLSDTEATPRCESHVATFLI